MRELVFVEQEPMAGKERVAPPGATIGREGCDITLPDPEASRRHAVVRELDGGPAIEDLGSTNGTIVNGQRIRGITALKDGDLVQIGNTKLRVRAPEPAAAEPAGGGVAAPQVTAARDIPPQPPAEPPTQAAPAPAPPPPAPEPALQATAAQPIPQQPPQQPPAARPPAPAPPQPATPLAGGAGERRGDVPRPDFAPSAIRRAVPPPTGQPQFNAPPSVRPGGGSAATRLEATVFVFAVALLTLVGVVLYYVTAPFE